MSKIERMHRVVEAVAWVGGVALLATYFGMRAWSAQASDKGLDAMRQARAGIASTPTFSSFVTARPNSLAVNQPDTSTWSRKRLSDYQAAQSDPNLPEAVLRVPKLKLEVPIYEGTSDHTLNRGAGRIEGTARIGEAGNLGIAAHRDGFFRPLKGIAVGDVMFLDTVQETRHYRVVRIGIVDPQDVSVLEPTSGATITLVTCYPFYFIGSAPKRFIVTAQLQQTGIASDFQ